MYEYEYWLLTGAGTVVGVLHLSFEDPSDIFTSWRSP